MNDFNSGVSAPTVADGVLDRFVVASEGMADSFKSLVAAPESILYEVTSYTPVANVLSVEDCALGSSDINRYFPKIVISGPVSLPNAALSIVGVQGEYTCVVPHVFPGEKVDYQVVDGQITGVVNGQPVEVGVREDVPTPFVFMPASAAQYLQEAQFRFLAEHAVVSNSKFVSTSPVTSVLGLMSEFFELLVKNVQVSQALIMSYNDAEVLSEQDRVDMKRVLEGLDAKLSSVAQVLRGQLADLKYAVHVADKGFVPVSPDPVLSSDGLFVVNPTTGQLISLKDAVVDPSQYVRDAAASSPKLSEDLMLKLLDYGDVYIEETLAGNPSATPKVLGVLSGADVDIKVLVTAHPNTSAATLQFLAGPSMPVDVMLTAISNPGYLNQMRSGAALNQDKELVSEVDVAAATLGHDGSTFKRASVVSPSTRFPVSAEKAPQPPGPSM